MVLMAAGNWGISEQGWRKGPWNHEEDKLLIQYVSQNGEGRWSFVSKCAGLNRSGKSCRLRWVNYLRPGLKKGHITPQEEGIIIELHALWGNKWSTIARYLPGRTDNEIKNYWRTHFKKRKPTTHDVQIRQQKRLAIRQKQKDQDKILDKTASSVLQATSEDKNSNQDTTTGIAFENKQYLPTIYQENTNNASWWSDFITVDSYLWDVGLSNFVDQNKMGIQNEDNIAKYSCEGDAINYLHNGESVF